VEEDGLAQRNEAFANLLLESCGRKIHEISQDTSSGNRFLLRFRTNTKNSLTTKQIKGKQKIIDKQKLTVRIGVHRLRHVKPSNFRKGASI
jgi:hypothetical protein